jgi:hypothetical protein
MPLLASVYGAAVCAQTSVAIPPKNSAESFMLVERISKNEEPQLRRMSGLVVLSHGSTLKLYIPSDLHHSRPRLVVRLVYLFIQAVSVGPTIRDDKLPSASVSPVIRSSRFQ